MLLKLQVYFFLYLSRCVYMCGREIETEKWARFSYIYICTYVYFCYMRELTPADYAGRVLSWASNSLLSRLDSVETDTTRLLGQGFAYSAEAGQRLLLKWEVDMFGLHTELVCSDGVGHRQAHMNRRPFDNLDYPDFRFLSHIHRVNDGGGSSDDASPLFSAEDATSTLRFSISSSAYC